MRPASAMALLRQGGHLQLVQRALGHASVPTICLHLENEGLYGAMDQD